MNEGKEIKEERIPQSQLYSIEMHSNKANISFLSFYSFLLLAFDVVCTSFPSFHSFLLLATV